MGYYLSNLIYYNLCTWSMQTFKHIVSALAQTRFQEVTALTKNKWGTRSTFQQLSMWYLLSSITPCLHRTRPARHNRKHKKRIRTHYNSKCGPHWMRCGHGVIVDNRHHIESSWNATNPLWTNRLSCRARCVRCRCCASQIQLKTKSASLSPTLHTFSLMQFLYNSPACSYNWSQASNQKVKNPFTVYS